MSHRRHPICQVSGKIRYREPKDAKVALRHADRHRSRARLNDVPCSHREIHSYNCPECDGWHLTSQSGWPVRPAPATALTERVPAPAAEAMRRMATATGLAAAFTNPTVA